MTAMKVTTTLRCDWRDPDPINERESSYYGSTSCPGEVTYEVSGGMPSYEHPAGDDSNNVNARRALRAALDQWLRSDLGDYCPIHARVLNLNRLARQPEPSTPPTTDELTTTTPEHDGQEDA